MIVILNKNNHIFKKEPNKIAYLFGALPYSEIYIYINRVQYCIRIHKKIVLKKWNKSHSINLLRNIWKLEQDLVCNGLNLFNALGTLF